MGAKQIDSAADLDAVMENATAATVHDNPIWALDVIRAVRRTMGRMEKEVLRLQGEVSNRNMRALEGDKADAALDRMTAELERLKAIHGMQALVIQGERADKEQAVRECWRLRKALEAIQTAPGGGPGKRIATQALATDNRPDVAFFSTGGGHETH